MSEKQSNPAADSVDGRVQALYEKAAYLGESRATALASSVDGGLVLVMDTPQSGVIAVRLPPRHFNAIVDVAKEALGDANRKTAS